MRVLPMLALLCALFAGALHAQSDNHRRRSELEQTLNAFADRYATHIVAATDAIAAGNPSSEQRRLAHLVKLGSVSSMYDIATEPEPVARILDMVLMVTLQSYLWIDEDRAEQMFGERGEQLRRAIRQMRIEVWSLAGTMARADQLQELDTAILEWRRRNPELSLVAYTRISDLSGPFRDDALQDIKRATGMFAEIAEATRVEDDTRLLAERSFYAMKRMPFLVNWQAEALLNEVLAKPEIRQALKVAEEMPGHIAREREAVVATLEDRNGRLTALLGEVRKTTAAANVLGAQALQVAEATERVTLNVRDTTRSVDAMLLRGKAEPAEVGKPFQIEPYLRAAAEVNQTVAGLNSALAQLDQITTKRAWAAPIHETQRLLADQMDQLFWRALVLMVAFFALLVLYRWLVSRIARR